MDARPPAILVIVLLIVAIGIGLANRHHTPAPRCTKGGIESLTTNCGGGGR